MRVTPDDAADIEAIKQLKYRYLRTLDLKQWDDFAECFVPEATGDYAGLAFEDRDALVAYMRENLGEGLISMHHAHHPEISVDGDSAETDPSLSGDLCTLYFASNRDGAYRIYRAKRN